MLQAILNLATFGLTFFNDQKNTPILDVKNTDSEEVKLAKIETYKAALPSRRARRYVATRVSAFYLIAQSAPIWGQFLNLFMDFDISMVQSVASELHTPFLAIIIFYFGKDSTTISAIANTAGQLIKSKK